MTLVLLRDPMPVPAYRPDIDGLRALAVVAVLLYHLDVAPFAGGFTGVDVFLVISGYLIGGIVLGDLQRGRYAIGTFLLRRVRRIVPMLLLVLAVTLAAGCLLLLPRELDTLAQSALAAAAFGANIFFYDRLEYYEAADSAPLVHMWSLGVEGQFYLCIALLVPLLWRLGPRALWVGLVALGVLSFAWGHYHPQERFYLLPSRFWEFMGGALVAVTPLPLLHLRVVREGLAAAGLVAVVIGVLFIASGAQFPNYRAILPVGGAAALLLAGGAGPTLTARLLSLPPVTFVGRISYSLYLWHWPVICLLLLGGPLLALTPLLKLAAAGLSFGLAVLSWHFVEQPCRRGSLPTKRLLAGCGAGLLALGLAVGAIVLSGGWKQRFGPETLRIAAMQDVPLLPTLRAGTCFFYGRDHPFDPARCLTARPGQPQVLLVGDSHAAHMWRGLDRRFTGSSILQVTAGGCRPLIRQPEERYDKCSELLRWALKDLVQQRRFALIIIAGSWEPSDLPYLDETLADLRRRGQPVLLVGDFAAWTYFVPRLLALEHWRGKPGLADGFLDPARRGLTPQLREVALRHGAAFFAPLEHQCDPRCHYVDEAGYPLIIDGAHLSPQGSEWIARFIEHPALRVRDEP